VLASKSPRRRKILESLGLEFEVVEVDGVEEERSGKAEEIALLNARRKAGAVAQDIKEGIIVGADTVVVHEGMLLGKPADLNEARGMLKKLSGNWHTVITGLAVIDVEGGRCAEGFERTEVKFRNLHKALIDRYLELTNPLDKAGGYAIQGYGALIVERIEGDYLNVVGLPVGRLEELMGELGYSLLDFVKMDCGIDEGGGYLYNAP